MSPEEMPSPPEGAHEFGEAIQTIGAFMAPLMDAAKGYMAQAKEAGFSDTSASEMGAQYHGLLVAVLTQQMVQNMLKPA